VVRRYLQVREIRDYRWVQQGQQVQQILHRLTDHSVRETPPILVDLLDQPYRSLRVVPSLLDQSLHWVPSIQLLRYYRCLQVNHLDQRIPGSLLGL